MSLRSLSGLLPLALLAACAAEPPQGADLQGSVDGLSQGACGPRDKPWLVIPDSLNVGVLCSVAGGATIVSAGKSADFGKACTHHDKCYWLLGSDRGACDATLGGDARDACRRAYKTVVDTPARECCFAFAEAYEAAVRSGGKEPYEDGQRDARRAAARYTEQTGYTVDATLIDMIAEGCLAHARGASCDTEAVAGVLVATQRRIEAHFAEYLERPPGEAELKELLALYWSGGQSLEPVSARIVERHGPEIVERAVVRVAGEPPTDAEKTELVGALRSFGIAYMKERIFIVYAKKIVEKIYLEVTGKPITFAWSQYYQRLLVQKKDVDFVRREIIRQHGPK